MVSSLKHPPTTTSSIDSHGLTPAIFKSSSLSASCLPFHLLKVAAFSLLASAQFCIRWSLMSSWLCRTLDSSLTREKCWGTLSLWERSLTIPCFGKLSSTKMSGWSVTSRSSILSNSTKTSKKREEAFIFSNKHLQSNKTQIKTMILPRRSLRWQK